MASRIAAAALGRGSSCGDGHSGGLLCIVALHSTWLLFGWPQALFASHAFVLAFVHAFVHAIWDGRPAQPELGGVGRFTEHVSIRMERCVDR
jgi:hypothetical protein